MSSTSYLVLQISDHNFVELIVERNIDNQ